MNKANKSEQLVGEQKGNKREKFAHKQTNIKRKEKKQREK